MAPKNRPSRRRRLWDALWSLFGSRLAHCGSLLACFGYLLVSFGSLLVVFGFFLVPLLSFWHPLAPLWFLVAPFCCILVPLCYLSIPLAPYINDLHLRLVVISVVVFLINGAPLTQPWMNTMHLDFGFISHVVLSSRTLCARYWYRIIIISSRIPSILFLYFLYLIYIFLISIL